MALTPKPSPGGRGEKLFRYNCQLLIPLNITKVVPVPKSLHLVGSPRCRLWTCCLTVACCLGVAIAPRADEPPTLEPRVYSPPAVGEFPTVHLLPKIETRASDFLSAHPEYDGRGITVAIFDDGLDPGAAGLRVTPDGRPKVIDVIDATGSGDVPLSDPVAPEEGQVEGRSGKMLTVPAEWGNELRLGIKPAFEFFPEELVERMRSTWTQKWNERQQVREDELIRQIAAWDDEHPDADDELKKEKEELEAQLSALRHAVENYKDPGPIYDCVVFQQGEEWRVAIDTNENGDLTDEKLLSEFQISHEYGTFADDSMLNFGVHVYGEGQTLSIVIPAGSHGTHVAGIVGAYYPDDLDRNGVAPGVQFVLVKIGDSRMGGMENGLAIIRGLQAVVEHDCDLVNMSYGEPSSTHNHGDLVERISELVNEHGVIYVASAGNAGPALSTVGAPGGTTTATLGIGAYVSQDMMAAQYAIYESYEGVPYTWTSRGPTFDGDFGIDLFAPGGAFSPIPTFMQQPQMQMNGTSMASPNCCGCIALILSGLKAEDSPYTPASVRRALQYTAVDIPGAEDQAEGAGLVQVDLAYDHLVAHAGDPAEGLMFEVAVNDDRGVYLREPEEVNREHELLADVIPKFHPDATSEEKLALALDCTLHCEADWVNCGDAVVIMSSGGLFRMHIDPTQLECGIHTTEVHGIDSKHPDRGPLFRVPITVVVPEAPQTRVAGVLETRAGEVFRKFLTVPEGATTMDVKLMLSEADSDRVILLHPLQLLEGQSGKDEDTLRFFSMLPGESVTDVFPVAENGTVEICLSQYWSRLGETTLDYEVVFRGIEPSDERITLTPGGNPQVVDVECVASPEFLEPSGEWTTWRRLITPSETETKLLDAVRDARIGGGTTSRLVLKYEFEMEESGTVTISSPLFDGLLYDSPVECFQWMIFDENDRMLACDDMYPDPHALEAGSYTIEVQLTDPDQDELEAFESMTLAVDTDLTEPVSMNFYANAAEVAAGGSQFEGEQLFPGDARRLWLTAPASDALPADVSNGDLLLGELTWETRYDDQSPRAWPVELQVSGVEESSDDEDSSDDEIDDDVKDLKLDHLRNLSLPDDQEDFDSLTAELKTEFPDDREVLTAVLDVLDAEEGREDRREEIIVAADAVIATFDASEIREGLGRRKDSEVEDGLTLEDAQDERDAFVKALYSKARAIAFRELPEVVEVTPIDDQSAQDAAFDAAYDALAEWVDPTEADYFLLEVRRHWRKGQYGQALEALNAHLDEAQPDLVHLEKRRDLYELLGWEDWKKYEAHWILVRFPADRVPF